MTAALHGLSDTKRKLFELLMRERMSPKIRVEQGSVCGEVAITPPQAHEFTIHNPDRHIFNLPLLLEVHAPLDRAMLEGILRALLEHHDALRLRSARGDRDYRQWIAAPTCEVPLTWVDLSAYSDAAEQRRILEAKLAEYQSSFELESQFLLKAAYFELGSGRAPRLLLLLHHTAVDAYSLGILASDFVSAYESLRSGVAPTLPPKTTSYLDWSWRLARFAESEPAQRDLTYWLERDDKRLAALPRDFPNGVNVGHAARTFATRTEIRGFGEVLRKHDLALPHALVFAVARALADVSQTDAALLSICHHGRSHPFPEIDVTRTVGWFAQQYPLFLGFREDDSALRRLQRVKAQLEAAPHQGLTFGVLRYMGPPEARRALAGLREPDLFLNIQPAVSLNLPGFALATENTGESASPSIVRPRDWYLNLKFCSEYLGFECLYNENLHRGASVESFLARSVEHLRAAIRGLDAGATSELSR